MYVQLAALGIFSAVLAGLFTWVVALRYGTLMAAVLPLVALCGTLGMIWLDDGLSLRDGLGIAAGRIVFALPAFSGVAIAILLHVRRRRAKGARNRS